MTCGRRAAGLVLSAALLGCHQYFVPDHPLRGVDSATTVEVRRVDFRKQDVEVALSGGSPSATVDGAWLFASGAPDGAPCARLAAASSIQPTGADGGGAIYTARFKLHLAEVLQVPSTLEVRVDGAAPRCLTIPFSGETAELKWSWQQWGDDPPFVNRAFRLWLPVNANNRYALSSDVMLFGIGRWWWPLRAGVNTGVGTNWATLGHPNGAYAVPVSLSVQGFPLVRREFALVLGASYELRPNYASEAGWELVHGPAAHIELARLPVHVPGFATGPRAGMIGLDFSYARWLPNGGANVVGVALSLN
ncbi:MAG TPA: hypothetical protein VGP64_15710 [Polyangia bacterium]|jgi:hypothetical protein